MNLVETKNITKIQSIYHLMPDLMHTWLIINKDDQSIGMFELQELTKVTAIIHMHIKSEYQNLGYAIRSYRPLVKYIKENTEYQSLMAPVPQNNKRMLRVLTKTDFKCCGVVPSGIVYDNQQQNLLLFELNVNEVQL